MDARGNTGAIDAQFSLTKEQFAFPVEPQQGDWLYETIYTAPVPAVIEVLQGFTSLRGFGMDTEHERSRASKGTATRIA